MVYGRNKKLGRFPYLAKCDTCSECLSSLRVGSQGIVSGVLGSEQLRIGNAVRVRTWLFRFTVSRDYSLSKRPRGPRRRRCHV